jgi:Fe-S cluster assembly iron-binding protein IscA
LGLTLDEPKKDEIAIQINGIDVLIADNVKRFAEKNIIDYVTEPYQEGFSIRNEDNTGCC